MDLSGLFVREVGELTYAEWLTPGVLREVVHWLIMRDPELLGLEALALRICTEGGSSTGECEGTRGLPRGRPGLV